MGGLKKKARSSRLDFDLNIVPIIDCLTILLTFMLASGAFISLGVLEIGIAGPSAEATQTKPPDIDLTVQLSPSRDISLVVSGKMRKRFTFGKQDSQWDFVGLNNKLEEFKKEFPQITSATLEAHQEIAYQDVVKAMETVKKSHPDVLLGGF